MGSNIPKRTTFSTLIIEPSSSFLEEFAFSQRHINVFASEAARCENVIYPILREVYKKICCLFYVVEPSVNFLRCAPEWDP